VLCIIDGNAGLRRAVGLVWLRAMVQRCCVHKQRGKLVGKPEVSTVSRHICNTIGRCHVCLGPLIFVSKGRDRKPSYYCSVRFHRSACSNGAGIPASALDDAVTERLMKMLNEDFDHVLDLCEEQAAIWRQHRQQPTNQRAQLEKEQKRLEGVISRLLDQIEAGQAVPARLKQRQEELDIVKAKLETDDEQFDRKAVTELLESSTVRS